MERGKGVPVFSGYVKGCRAVRVCHANRALNSLDYLKQEAINDSLINPKMVVIATITK